MLTNRDPAHQRQEGSAPQRRSAHESRPAATFTAEVRPGRAFAVSSNNPPFSGGAPPSDDRPSGLEYAELDGTTHINIWPRSKCELGRKLSHFAKSPFVHPYYGPFNSMEGFWYYIKAAKQDDKLRLLYGSDAKFYGRSLPQGPLYQSFYEVIVEANFHKIVQNAPLREALADSVLPLDHYFLWGAAPMFIRPVGFEWLVEGFESIRRELKYAASAGLEPAWASPIYEAFVG